jgi:hypothetical protein
MAKHKQPDFSAFYEWQDPGTLDRLCDDMREVEEAKRGEFSNIIASGMNPLLEAMTASSFGLRFGVEHPGVEVRIRSEPEPDFQLRAPDIGVMACEAVEAEDTARERGAEYKEIRKVPREQREVDHVGEAWGTEHNGIVASVIAARVADKASKTYKDEHGQPIRPHLVIRDNLRHDATPEELAMVVHRWRDSFPSIWALEPDGRLVQLAPDVRVVGKVFPSANWTCE